MSNGFLAKAHRKVERLTRRWTRTPKQLDELAAAGPMTAPLARALRAAIQKDLSDSEKAWIDRIEALRARLERSRETVEVVDFGAGQPDDVRTADEMRQGTLARSAVGDICRTASRSPRWCLVLFELIRHLEPQRAVELGTSLGISSAYEGAAMALNGHGRMITLEGAPALAERARGNLAGLDLARVEVVEGRFDEVLRPALEEMAPVDYLFVDGHHDETATLAYFEAALPFLGEGATVVFDDIDWSPGMVRAWRKIESHSEVTVALDLYKLGVVQVHGGEDERTRMRLAVA